MKPNNLTILSISAMLILSLTFSSCLEKEVAAKANSESKTTEEHNKTLDDGSNSDQGTPPLATVNVNTQAKVSEPPLATTPTQIEPSNDAYSKENLSKNFQAVLEELKGMDANAQMEYLQELDECTAMALITGLDCIKNREQAELDSADWQRLQEEISALSIEEKISRTEEFLTNHPTSPIREGVLDELAFLKESKAQEDETQEEKKVDSKPAPKEFQNIQGVSLALQESFDKIFSFYFSLGGTDAVKDMQATDVLNNFFSDIDRAYSLFGKITPESLKELEQNDRIAVFINLYNTMAIDLLTRKMSENPHEALNLQTSGEDIYEKFFSGDFFTKAQFTFDNLGDVSLNTILKDILMNSNEDSSVMAKAFNRALGFDAVNHIPKEYLFFLSFGSPAGPMLYDLPRNLPLRGEDLANEELLADVVGKFLNDPERGVWIKHKGFINPNDTMVPWLLRIYFGMEKGSYSHENKEELMEFLKKYVTDFKDKGIVWNTNIALLSPGENSSLSIASVDTEDKINESKEDSTVVGTPKEL